MEWESDSPCLSHAYPGQEYWSPGRCSGWELELRNCAAIPGRGPLLTVERWIEGMWGRRQWWELLRALTKENALALIVVDIGGKNIQEQDQVRTWAAPTAGPEISPVLEGIPGRWGGLWLPERVRTLTAVTQEKNIYYSYFSTCSVGSFGFFLSAPHQPTLL